LEETLRAFERLVVADLRVRKSRSPSLLRSIRSSSWPTMGLGTRNVVVFRTLRVSS
jgi:hypothetical protein